MTTTPTATKVVDAKNIYPIQRCTVGYDFRNPRWSWNGIIADQIAAGKICVICTNVWPICFRTMLGGTNECSLPSAGATTLSWNDDRPCHIDPGTTNIHPIIMIHKAVVAWYKYTNCFCRWWRWLVTIVVVNVVFTDDEEENARFEIMVGKANNCK